ncbi:carbon-nitrogen hydrolase family protein [Rhodococcus koreensis]
MVYDKLPTVRAAAVQAAPVFLDRDATIDKLDNLTAQAASEGAELVVFGESFVPGFPIWNGVLPPIDQHEFHARLYANSLEVPGPHCDQLGRIAERHGVVLSVGITERSNVSVGQMYNANLIFDRNGRLINHRRKLVATWHERLTWSHGDGHDLEPVDLDGWRLGALICGENTNTLARFALLGQGERLHIATFPPAWAFDSRTEGGQDLDLTAAITIRTIAHSYEGKVFNVVAASAVDDDAIAQVANGNQEISDRLRAMPGMSMIVNPQGQIIAGPLVAEEGILHATLDLSEELLQKTLHDITGTYNRFDVFNLRVNKTRHMPVTVTENVYAAADQSQMTPQNEARRADEVAVHVN